MALLELNEVCKHYGSLRVVDRLTLAVDEGEAVGVIGPNGAGKTTMFNLINGTVRPDSGSIVFAGRTIERDDAARRCRAGVGRTHQIPSPFSAMTVFENVMVGSVFGAGLKGAAADERCVQVLALTNLLRFANQPAGKLRLLDRKRLELARALATQPRLLLLDEIGGGLTGPEVQQLVATILKIHARGVTVVWVEHIVNALVSAVDRLVVMSEGRLLAEGKPREVLASREVQAVYMGVDAAPDAPPS